MSPPTTGLSAKRYKIMKHIESCVHNYVLAASQHDYSPTSPLWSSLASTFLADPNIGDKAEAPRTRSEFLASRARSHEENPSYGLRILEISTTLNDTCDEAKVFVKYEAFGVPEGIVQQVAGVLDFKPLREEGEEEEMWKCVRFRSMRGLTGPVI